MSQRKEKRFRALERRVAALEDRALEEEHRFAEIPVDAWWTPAEPGRGIIQRIAAFFWGR